MDRADAAGVLLRALVQRLLLFEPVNVIVLATDLHKLCPKVGARVCDDDRQVVKHPLRESRSPVCRNEEPMRAGH
jgi:hypothetical protein